MIVVAWCTPPKIRSGTRSAVVLATLLGAGLGGACTSDSGRTARSGDSSGAVGWSEAPGADANGEASSVHEIPEGTVAEVEWVYDGDTIRVSELGKVRLIGIDAPEEDPTRGPVQCFGIRSAEGLRSLLPEGTEVTIVEGEEPTDQYGRALGYVYRNDDGLFLNEELLRLGLVQAYRVPPNLEHAEAFGSLQRAARDGEVGLWGECHEGDLTDRPGGAQPRG